MALARSLVTEPSILLLDEPLSNLDVALRERMRDEIKELHQRTGITFVYVTHDQSEAIALSDRIAVLNAGRLCQYGPPLELYERPADRFVAGFLGAANLLDGVADGNGRLVLPDGAGRIALPGGATAARGEAVTVMIRPEDVTLAPVDPGLGLAEADGVLTGTVEQRTLLGYALEYRIRCGQAVLRVHAGRGGGHAQGDVVRLLMPPQRCAVVPGPAAAGPA